jgi:hypothetical protein
MSLEYHKFEDNVLERYCVDHCYLENWPHKDEVSVELNRMIQSPEYSHLVQNGSPKETFDIHQQGTSTKQLEDKEAVIPCGKGYPRIVSRISKKNWRRPKGILVTQIARSTPGGTKRSRGNSNDRREYRLSAKAIDGTCSSSRACHKGMQ